MTTLFLDESLIDLFQRRVVPVLEARAVQSLASPAESLLRLLNDRPRLWTVEVQWPAVGAVFPVEFTRQGPPEIHDTRVFVPDLPDGFQGKRIVRVDGVYGLSVSCTVVNAPMAERAGPMHRLLALSCREVTVLADLLPGKDCFFGIALWANEMLPLAFLVQRPRQLLLLERGVLTLALLRRDQLGFATACERCRSLGKLTCDKCSGSGVFKPQRTCPKCGGSGQWSDTCRKCGGSGRYIRGGSCNRCQGSGRLTFPCRACEARGYFPQQDCTPCQGAGTIPCFVCKASGRGFVRFSSRDGSFSRNLRGEANQQTRQVLPPHQVAVVRWTDNTAYTVHGGGERLLGEVKERTSGQRSFDLHQAVALQEYCDQTGRIQGCLVKSMAAQGIQETRPIRIANLRASLRRMAGAVVYEFQVTKSSRSWARDGVPPFPRSTPLVFLTSDGAGRLEPIELPWQGQGGPGQDDRTPVLLDCQGKGSQLRVHIRFPRAIDVGRLPPELFIQPATPPPGEIAQMRHLRQWCGRDNRDHPVLHAVVFPGTLAVPLPDVRPYEPGIDRHPVQKRAVQLGVSELPLALIKGPPGTGKTTVITEIVRQLVARGQKVLICSQTHQAVRNVLERLDQLGGFRMVRYGREEHFSDVEKRYRDGGLGDTFHQAVVERARKALSRFRAQGDWLTSAHAALNKAKAAASQLAALRLQTARERQRLEDARRQGMTEADQILTRDLQAAQQEEASRSAPHRAALQAVQQQLPTTQAQLSQARTARDKVAAAYRTKTGRDPIVVAVTSSFLTTLRDKLLPDVLVSANALQERYSAHAEQARQLENRATELARQSAEATRAVEDLQRRRLAAEQRSRAAHDQKRHQIQARHDEQAEKLGQQAQETEAVMRGPQRDALSYARSLGTNATEDSPPELWDEPYKQAAAQLAQAQARSAFVGNWIHDVEADPQSLAKCYWDNLQVFFSTCVGLSSWRPLVERGRDAVDLVIVDEAAHATVTETLVPLLYARRALLIGDEMQLPPILVHDVACAPECTPPLVQLSPAPPVRTAGIAAEVRMGECWLECSFFEWLWRSRPQVPRVMLDTQFRMHAAIADFVGSVFYPEGLRTGVADADRHLAFGEFTKPVCLISTSAYPGHHEEFLDPGYRNELEAKLVRRVVEKAEAELGAPQTFGVITPYAHQVNLVVHMLGPLLPALQRVRLKADYVASVDSFQGSERDVIIISFVRSPAPCPRCQGKGRKGPEQSCSDCRGRGWRGTELTFVRDLRRLNVAFSRARKMLILIGDIDALTDSRYRGGAPGGKVLDEFRQYVANRGKVLHVWERGSDGR